MPVSYVNSHTFRIFVEFGSKCRTVFQDDVQSDMKVAAHYKLTVATFTFHCCTSRVLSVMLKLTPQ